MKSKLFEGVTLLAEALGTKVPGKLTFLDLEVNDHEFVAELCLADQGHKLETQLSIDRGAAHVYEVVTANIGSLRLTARVSRPALPADVESFAERMRREQEKATQKAVLSAPRPGETWSAS